MTWKYDVFVSFRGDTRNNFTDHLFAALQRNNILAFRDNTKLKKGESIAPELLQAIEGSRIFIVVFSKNFASSTWCLRELAKILDCLQASEKRVLPIFYDVDPSEVRKQSGIYEKAFVEHEERFRQDLKKIGEMQRWREALTHVGNLSGWDIRDKPENAEIEKIVKEIISILNQKISSIPDDLVGIESPVEELERLLLLSKVEDVRVVGICGMGGIGKTTLATVLWDKISSQFDACCFIADVSKSHPIDAQKQLLRQALNEENLHIFNLYDVANLIRNRLRQVRTLIVLDNVDQVEQLEKLGVNREWLGAGSRIIITSRDLHILRGYGVDNVYNVELLNGDNALKLFCRKAFKCDNIRRDYEALTLDILSYANGLPLAIKVLGSFLFGRCISEWRSSLDRLRKNPRKDIMGVLRISYDGLEETEKEIFLDIACFFKGEWVKRVNKYLFFCGFEPNIGISVLVDKSLLTISNSLASFPPIEMHDLLQELGKNIVRGDSPKEPRKWSRLWDYKDFCKVMLEEKMENNVEAIVINSTDETPGLMAAALSKMSHLRLLILRGVKFSGSLNGLSKKLRYVEWHEYPFMDLPSSFEPDELVCLSLNNSSIKQLWEGKKYIPSLIELDLSHSKNLVKMPDMGEVPNLEELRLEGCVELVEIDQSIGLLRNLTDLVLKNCKNLESIPSNILGLTSLQYLSLSGCSKVCNNQLTRHAEHLKSETAMPFQSTSSFIGRFLSLLFGSSYARTHKDSASSVLHSLPTFSLLKELDLSFCDLIQIPDAIGSLQGLEWLDLEGNKFVTVTCSLKELSNLVYLNLSHNKHLTSLPELPSCTMPELPSCTNDRVVSQWRRLMLYIFDCPNLGERERCRTMMFSWMIKCILLFKTIDIVTPGSEIPWWFSNQTVGYSIVVDPSPIMHDNDWIGIACCAVFVARPFYPITLKNEPKCFMYVGFTHKGNRLIADSMLVLDRDEIRVESDHIWLFYLSREESIDFMSGTALLKGKTDDLEDINMNVWFNGHEGLPFEVKKCAYHWVFKEDVELLQKMYNGDSSAKKAPIFSS